MKTDIASPLLPIKAAKNEPLSPYSTLGIVADLCINHGDYCQLSIDELMARVLPALQVGQAHIVFDLDNRPLGSASWILADDATHERLLESPSVTHALNEPTPNTATIEAGLYRLPAVTAEQISEHWMMHNRHFYGPTVELEDSMAHAWCRFSIYSRRLFTYNCIRESHQLMLTAGNDQDCQMQIPRVKAVNGAPGS